MKSKFMRVKRLVMPLIQAIMLVQNLAGCGAVSQSQFVELLDTADDTSVELYIGQLDENGSQSTVWVSQAGVNSIQNTEAKGLASDFISGYKALKPAQTLMGVFTGNASESKYFVEPNQSVQTFTDKSQEFQVAYTAATDLYAQIAPDQLKVNDQVQKIVKAALASQVYYNTWSATFDTSSSNVATDFYNGSLTKLDMLVQVFNAVYGYENIPGDSELYGQNTESMINNFKQSLSDLAEKINEQGESATEKQLDLAESIENLTSSQDCDNIIRKLMYMTRYSESNPFENTTEFDGEDSEKNVVDSLYFSNATKMDAIQVIYNLVRANSTSLDNELKEKDYTSVTVESLDSTQFKDMNGNKINVQDLDAVYTKATAKGQESVSTERTKVDIVREYQAYNASNKNTKEIVITSDQWEVYQDAKANTSILQGINSNTTADNRLLGNLSVTDLYSMLLGASADLKGYSASLEGNTTEIVTDVETEDTTQQEETEEYVYNFEKYVYQYQTANDLSDEEILASVESEEALYQWLQDSGVTYAEAARDETFGCENVFIGRYLAWLVENDDTLSKAPEPEVTESTSTNDSTTSETAGTTGTTGTTGEVSAKDFLREDGTFDAEGYRAALGTTKEQAIADTEKAANGAIKSEEDMKKQIEESYEFGQKVAEAFESGIIDEIYNELKEEGRWVD